MKAVVLEKVCLPEEMNIKEVQIPKIKNDHVLIKIFAFGLNHSELILRSSEIDNEYIKKPIIPGIECVGEVIDKSNSNFEIGDKVIALMGGLGRSFDGSYAEFVLVPIKNVFKIKTNLSWNELASIPETYFTAYGSLFDCLQLNKNDSLLIRGGTSALGIAAIKLAKAIGTKVIATSTKQENYDLLKSLGADIVILDNENIKSEMDKHCPDGVTKILELVGPKTLSESLTYLKYHGILCDTGVLGGVYNLNNFDPIKEIPNGVYLTSFYSNYPTQEKIDEMFELLNKYNVKPYIFRTFKFDEIRQAHRMMENHETTGKLVVVVD